MTRIKLIVLLAALVHLTTPAAAASAQSGTKADEKTLAYLKNFRADYVRSSLAGDPAGVQSYCADGIRLMPEYQKTVMGKGDALSYRKAFTVRFDVREYDRDEIEILDFGTRVVELGVFAAKMTARESGRKHELNGKYLNIWERGGDGTLSLITEAWNYDSQTAVADQVRFEEVPAVHVALRAHVPIRTNISFELAALNRLMEATITQHDADVWSQFYTDDAVLLYSHNPVRRGRKALNEFFAKHAAELPIFEKLDVRNDHIDDLGDYVIEYASHIAVVRSGGYSGTSTGKDVRIWRREKGGSLKIFRAVAMYD